MAKRTKKTSNCGPPIDVFETMQAEITEAVKLMRPHFPDDEMTLRRRAEGLRQRRYHAGHWPDFATMAKEEAEAAAKAAEAKAVEAAALALAEHRALAESAAAEAAEEEARATEAEVEAAEP